MATTISTNSPKLTANIADHADVFGGRSLVFDGITDYLEVQDTLESIFQASYSFSLWLKADDGQPSSDQSLFGVRTGANGSIQNTVRGTIKTNGKLFFRYHDGSNNSDAQTNSAVFLDGATDWTHIAIVVSESADQIYIYVNGYVQTLDGTLDGDTSSLTFSNFGTSNNFPIGGRNNLGTVGEFFSGKMCDFKIFNTALTESQVTELYRKPENTPSAVQNNLVAWYPMIEGNPESPQSIVYDCSAKGLGSEISGDPSFDNASNWLIFLGNGSVDVNTTTAGKLTVVNAQDKRLQKNDILTVGKLYKVTFVIDSYSNGRVRGTFDNAITFIPTGAGTYSRYFVASQTYFVIQFDNTNANMTMTDISIKEVLMGNHAQTNFFGDELFDSNARTFEGTSTYGWAVYGNNTITNDSNTLKITRVDNNQGAYLYLRNATDLTTDLTVGTTYLLKGDFLTTDASKTFTVRISNSGGTDIAYNSLNNTSFVTKEFEFVAGHATNAFIVVENLATDGVVKVDNLTLKEVGISSSGFDTAVNEPVVPQVPLMRYNQKMLVSSDASADTYVLLPDGLTQGLTEFTFSIWHRKNIGENSRLLAVDGGGSYIRFLSPTRLYAHLPAQTGSFTIDASGIVDDGNLHHYVLSISASSNESKLYVDGVLKETDTNDGNYYNSNIRRIGNYAGYQTPSMNDEFSIFNTALNQTQVQELFNDGVALDATTHSQFIDTTDLLGGSYDFTDTTQWNQVSNATRTSATSITATSNNGYIRTLNSSFESDTRLYKISIQGSVTTGNIDLKSWGGQETYKTGITGTFNETVYANTSYGGLMIVLTANTAVATITSLKIERQYLLGYWRNDGVTTWTDRSGVGNDGTVQGNPDSITIREGLNANRDALGFYFTSDTKNVLRLWGEHQEKLSINNFGASFERATPITLMAWIKYPQVGGVIPDGTGKIFSDSSKQFSFSSELFNSGAKIRFLAQLGGVSSSEVQYFFDPTSPPSHMQSTKLTDWIHVAFTITGDVAVGSNEVGKIYLNGTLVHTDTSSVLTSNAVIGNVHIGQDRVGNSYVYHYIDELMVYNKVLSASEVEKNYKFSKGKHKND